MIQLSKMHEGGAPFWIAWHAIARVDPHPGGGCFVYTLGDGGPTAGPVRVVESADRVLEMLLEELRAGGHLHLTKRLARMEARGVMRALGRAWLMKRHEEAAFRRLYGLVARRVGDVDEGTDREEGPG